MSSVLHILMIERVVLQSIYWWLSTSRDNIYVFINSHCANIFKFLIYYLLKLSFPIFWNGNSQLLSGRLHSSTWALKLGIYLCIYPRVLLNINALDKRLFAHRKMNAEKLSTCTYILVHLGQPSAICLTRLLWK